MQAQLRTMSQQLQEATVARDEEAIQRRIATEKADAALKAQLVAQAELQPVQRQLKEATSTITALEAQLARTDAKVRESCASARHLSCCCSRMRQLNECEKQVASAQDTAQAAAEDAAAKTKADLQTHWRRMRAEWDEMTHRVRGCLPRATACCGVTATK